MDKKTLNDDFYHTTSRSTVIFGVHASLSYHVLGISLRVCLCPIKQVTKHETICNLNFDNGQDQERESKGVSNSEIA